MTGSIFITLPNSFSIRNVVYTGVVTKLARSYDGQVVLIAPAEWKLPIEVEFPMPVQVKLRGKLLRVEMPEGTAVLDVPKGAKFEIDPDRLILKKEPRGRRRR